MEQCVTVFRWTQFLKLGYRRIFLSFHTIISLWLSRSSINLICLFWLITSCFFIRTVMELSVELSRIQVLQELLQFARLQADNFNQYIFHKNSFPKSVDSFFVSFVANVHFLVLNRFLCRYFFSNLYCYFVHC